jgi:hypothetical protein
LTPFQKPVERMLDLTILLPELELSNLFVRELCTASSR